MPIIRPTSDLKNHLSELAELAHQEKQPIFITKNGRGDLVLLSQELWEQQQATLTVYRKLAEAEAEKANGSKAVSHRDMMKEIQEIIDGQR